MRPLLQQISLLQQVTRKRAAWLVAGVVACASLATGTARSTNEILTGGTAAVYGHIPPDQVEFLTSKDRILSVSRGGSPSAIWEALEHGERVECLDCIPQVAPLLYDSSPVTREIAAWWLRRRVFGVFGPGQVYETTIKTLKNDPSPSRRAYAAEALGEFLAAPGITACAEAIEKDSDPAVRAAAAKALGRLNDDGKGALSRALTDQDKNVKLAALKSAGRINAFNDVMSLVALTSDGDATVRRRAAEVIGAHRAKDAVGALVLVAQNDPDADARSAAAHALGLLGDPAARPALEGIAAKDSNRFVRDLAQIALRRL